MLYTSPGASTKKDFSHGWCGRVVSWIDTIHFPITSNVSPVTMIAVLSDRPMPSRFGYF
jgi:hypothetical protein